MFPDVDTDHQSKVIWKTAHRFQQLFAGWNYYCYWIKAQCWLFQGISISSMPWLRFTMPPGDYRKVNASRLTKYKCSPNPHLRIYTTRLVQIMCVFHWKEWFMNVVYEGISEKWYIAAIACWAVEMHVGCRFSTKLSSGTRRQPWWDTDDQRRGAGNDALSSMWPLWCCHAQCQRRKTGGLSRVPINENKSIQNIST